MMRTLPLRLRLTLVYGGLLFIALAISGSAVVTLLNYRLTVRMDAALDHRLQGVENFLIRETTLATEHMIPVELEEYASTQPEGHYIEVRDQQGKVLLTSAAVLPPARTRERSFSIYGKTYHTRAAASEEPIADSIQEVGLLLLASSPILLTLIGMTGYWISSRSLQPVDQMTQAARSIGANNLSARLPVPPAKDEISRLAEAWNEMLARLEDSFLRMQRFTADAAHEFRTPLAALRTTVDLSLKRERQPTDYRDALAQVATIADRMNQLAEGLLSIARGDQSHPRLQMTAVDFNTLVREVVAEMEPLFTDRDLVLKLHAPKTAIVLFSDEDGLRRILAILLDNALKYSSLGGTVAVVITEQPDALVLEVTDTGCGIPAESLALIFDRFYRVDPSRDRKSGGYGLGLAIAQQIARAHHGQIEATSTLGKGSTFRLTLPPSDQTQTSSPTQP
jgi:heavy metal sensor kinase